MWDKIVKILGSVRFWIITLGAISAYVAIVETSGFVWSEMFNTVAVWLGVVAGVGTADKYIEQASGYYKNK